MQDGVKLWCAEWKEEMCESNLDSTPQMALFYIKVRPFAALKYFKSNSALTSNLESAEVFPLSLKAGEGQWVGNYQLNNIF